MERRGRSESVLEGMLLIVILVFVHILTVQSKYLSELGKDGYEVDHWVTDIIEGIYITDVKFHFDHNVHKYEVNTEKCMDKIELLVEIPSWKNGDIEGQYEFHGNTDADSVGKMPYKSEDDSTGMLPYGTDNLSDDEKRNANIGMKYRDVEGNMKRGCLKEVEVKINGQVLDPQEEGYVNMPLHCGHRHEFSIDIMLGKENKTRYVIVIEVPNDGEENTIEILEISRADRIVMINPMISRVYRRYTVCGNYLPGDIVTIYAECRYGIPSINGDEANTVTLQIDDTILLSNLEITCNKFVEGNRAVNKTLYILKFPTELANYIPPPRLMLVTESKPCQLSGEGNTESVIICPASAKRFGPLLVDTDPKYLYLIHRSYVVDDYIEEIHYYRLDYIKVQTGVITPVFDLHRDLLIYGISGENSKMFTIRMNRDVAHSGIIYKSLLGIYIKISYWTAIVMTLLPAILMIHKDVVFDNVPVMICANRNTGDVCNNFLMLPTMKNCGSYRPGDMLQFYIYLLLGSIIMGIISISGRRENQLRKEMGIKNVEPYTPVDALLRLFIFPWVFLSMQLVLVPIFYRDEPRIKIEFLKGKPQMDVARGHDWLEFIQYYSFVPLAIMALIAQRSVVMKLLHRFTAIWQSIGESKYIWIWDAGSIRRNLSQYSYYEDDDSDQMVTQIRAYYANRTNGYWMEHKCNLLTTQFAKTLSTQILPLINRRYAVVAAEIREVNLCKLDDPLDVDMWEMYDTGYWSLNETRLSFDQGVPEALELSHRKNSEQSGVTLKVVSTVGENPINGGIRRPHVESYGGINDETAVWLQLEYISNIDKRFGNKVIATVEARYVTYFITYNLTRNTDRFVTDLSINKVVKMRTVIQAQVKQLRAVDNRHGSIIRRDVRVPLAVEGLVIMKAITGFLAAIILVSGKRMASFLELVQIMACISATVIFASQPYCNKVDNYVSFLCMAMGLAVKLLPGFQDTKSPWNTLTCLVLTTLIAHATVATVAFIIDSAALLWFPQDDNIEESNVIIVVKDANERVVGIIQGNCRVTIVQSLVTFDDKGQVTLFPNGDRRRMPTIAVSLEHIDAASWYIPFITIAYMSNMADAFSINQSQANKTFLKNYLSSRFGTRVAQSLARRIVNHVNENKEAVCFCFYIAD